MGQWPAAGNTQRNALLDTLLVNSQHGCDGVTLKGSILI